MPTPYEGYLKSITGTMGQNNIPVYPQASMVSPSQLATARSGTERAAMLNNAPVRNPFGSGIQMPQPSASSQRVASFSNLSPGYTSPGAGPQPYAPRGEQPMGMPPPPPAFPTPAAHQPTFDDIHRQRYGQSFNPAYGTSTPVPNEVPQSALDFQKARQAENWGTGPGVGSSNALVQAAADSGFSNAAGLLYNGIGNYAGDNPQQKIAGFNQGALANTPGITFDPAKGAFVNTAGGGTYQAPIDPRWENVFAQMRMNNP